MFLKLTGLLDQALTTSYYAHNVSAIEESWLSEIPGLSDGSMKSVRQSFDDEDADSESEQDGSS